MTTTVAGGEKRGKVVAIATKTAKRAATTKRRKR
jgi:hypothetical protein